MTTSQIRGKLLFKCKQETKFGRVTKSKSGQHKKKLCGPSPLLKPWLNVLPAHPWVEPTRKQQPRFLRVSHKGTQRIVSVNYLFGRPLIPNNFLKIIFASNFRDMGNLWPGVFGLIKMSFQVPKKGQLRFSERK